MLTLGPVEFTIGRAKFSDTAPWAAETPKIYVKFTPESLGVVLLAALDTGAPWSILDTDVADTLGLLKEHEEPTTTVTTWRGRVRGHLERIGLTLHADEGDSLDLEATVLVVPDWRGNFLGYGGLLQHIRFAVDAGQNFFYFGKD